MAREMIQQAEQNHFLNYRIQGHIEEKGNKAATKIKTKKAVK